MSRFRVGNFAGVIGEPVTEYVGRGDLRERGWTDQLNYQFLSTRDRDRYLGGDLVKYYYRLFWAADWPALVEFWHTLPASNLKFREALADFPMAEVAAGD